MDDLKLNGFGGSQYALKKALNCFKGIANPTGSFNKYFLNRCIRTYENMVELKESIEKHKNGIVMSNARYDITDVLKLAEEVDVKIIFFCREYPNKVVDIHAVPENLRSQKYEVLLDTNWSGLKTESNKKVAKYVSEDGTKARVNNIEIANKWIEESIKEMKRNAQE